MKPTGRRKTECNEPPKTIKRDPKSSGQHPPSLFHDKINTFLKDKEIWCVKAMQGTQMQFWKPLKTINGRTLLTGASGPFHVPFAFSHNNESLSRYRNHMVRHEYWVGDDEGQLGPIERAFKQQSSEYCPNISRYSKDEHHSCVGVLECISNSFSCGADPDSTSFDIILRGLKWVGLTCLGSHSDPGNNCHSQVSQFVSQMRMGCGLKFVGEYTDYLLFRQSEEFSVNISHSDGNNFVYFDVHRSGKPFNTYSSGHEKVEKFPSSDPPSSTLGASVSKYETNDATARENNSAQTKYNLIQQSGRKFEDEAAAIGVTTPALKHRCQELGVHWWPLLKKHKGDHILSDPKLPSTSVEPSRSEVIKELEIGSCPYSDATKKEASNRKLLPTMRRAKVF
ncbi:OLC1v1015590C1 [Oldenlandia corymbosa var. corymbosa]|uniref:OLC1v1015590C1 n=1 Tax=Oldenlandia corymbosa var. corymbosa TaxID=529605 RepID=A0AAV1E3F6_OLDCO|nr:OLC1v1015590C1 [Oldenlandia corymbosa var. corymbosa]